MYALKKKTEIQIEARATDQPWMEWRRTKKKNTESKTRFLSIWCSIAHSYNNIQWMASRRRKYFQVIVLLLSINVGREREKSRSFSVRIHAEHFSAHTFSRWMKRKKQQQPRERTKCNCYSLKSEEYSMWWRQWLGETLNVIDILT